MTAGMFHVTNLTPGSECQPYLHRLFRGANPRPRRRREGAR
jgi:hypothetical protein